MITSKRTFLHNAIDMVCMGSHTLENDDFTRCFQPISAIEMDSSGIFYIFSFVIRYFILFPLRLVFLGLCSIIFLVMIAKSVVTKSDEQLERAFVFATNALIIAINAKMKHIGDKKRLDEPHVYVANHTSFIDFFLLSSHRFPHACISEHHGGLFGFLFKSVLMRNGSIAFKRSEKVDRQLVVERLREHIAAGGAPMLIFPEGTCVNNKFSVLFQKGAFELGVTVCPVAIKFKRGLVDPYWNRRVHGFTAHMFYLMTRWRIEVEITWIEPIRMMDDETPTQFSHRTKILISREAGLKNTLWNGFLKSNPAIKDREILREAYVKTYKKLIDNLNMKEVEEVDPERFYLHDSVIDASSARNHLYFGHVTYKRFQNEILKEYLRLKELPPTDLKFLLSNHRSREESEEMFCSCEIKEKSKNTALRHRKAFISCKYEGRTGFGR